MFVFCILSVVKSVRLPRNSFSLKSCSIRFITSLTFLLPKDLPLVPLYRPYCPLLGLQCTSCLLTSSWESPSLFLTWTFHYRLRSSLFITRLHPKLYDSYKWISPFIESVTYTMENLIVRPFFHILRGWWRLTLFWHILDYMNCHNLKMVMFSHGLEKNNLQDNNFIFGTISIYSTNPNVFCFRLKV